MLFFKARQWDAVGAFERLYVRRRVIVSRGDAHNLLPLIRFVWTKQHWELVLCVRSDSDDDPFPL